jgi:hypothetical protein
VDLSDLCAAAAVTAGYVFINTARNAVGVSVPLQVSGAGQGRRPPQRPVQPHGMAAIEGDGRNHGF